MQKAESIIIRDNKLVSLSRFHPWVFSGALKKVPILEDGTIVRLIDRENNYIATGYYQNSSIAVRILDRTDCDIDQGFWIIRINEAISLRKSLDLISNQDTNCFRLINGEGDRVPGLIVDYYDGYVVIQIHTTGMFKFLKLIKKAFEANVDLPVTKFIELDKSGLNNENDKSVDTKLVLENGIQFEVNPTLGQKTGLFLDQRNNRKLLGSYSKGKKVLNLFCYTGAFSLYALKNGAQCVDSVDISQFAIDSLERNLIVNNIQDGKHQSFKSNIKKFLPELTKDYYDIIIVDPPAYAKHRNKRHNAVTAYKRLNIEALNKVKKEGLIFTFSCSQVVDTNLFENTIRAAAIESGREIKIIHHLSQAPDHPTDIYHIEGRYLKGLVLYVR